MRSARQFSHKPLDPARIFYRRLFYMRLDLSGGREAEDESSSVWRRVRSRRPVVPSKRRLFDALFGRLFGAITLFVVSRQIGRAELSYAAPRGLCSDGSD